MATTKNSVRSTIDLPALLYRALKEQATQHGCSVGELIINGAKMVLLKSERPARRRGSFPLIESSGPKVRLSSEKLYELIEFP